MERKKGNFSDGCFTSFIVSILIIFSIVNFSGIITPILSIIPFIDETTSFIIIFLIPVPIGIFKYIKYKHENRRLALGYLIGSFIPIINILAIYGSCGLMF